MPDLHIRLTEDDSGDAAPLTVPLLDEAAALDMLNRAEIVAEKLVPWGSNYTFAVGLEIDGEMAHIGIYKPKLGERPLWDFPNGTLYLREYGAYLLSRWLGWDLVPPTVVRDGPHGPGSLQLYVEPTEEEIDEATFWGRRIVEIERMVTFDFLTNNADRKIGHCLVDVTGRLWAIDHGLTFNQEPKLRTVLWQFSGEPFGEEVAADLARLQDDSAEIYQELAAILDGSEIQALKRRARNLFRLGTYPLLDPGVNIPYGWW